MSVASLAALGGIGAILVGLLVWRLVARYGSGREDKGRLTALLEVHTGEGQAKKARARELARRSYSRDELIRHGMRQARADSFVEGAVPGDQPADVGGADRGDE